MPDVIEQVTVEVLQDFADAWNRHARTGEAMTPNHRLQRPRSNGLCPPAQAGDL